MYLEQSNRIASRLLPCAALWLCASVALGQISAPDPFVPLAPSAVDAGALAASIDFGDTDRIPEFVYRRTAEFLAINHSAVEFADKVPYVAQPIYAHGVDGIAYYEIWLTRDGRRTEGWLLLSATDADYPLVNFSHEGTPYSQKVLARANELGEPILPDDRIFRFGVSYFALETSDGRPVADYGEMPTWLPAEEEISGAGSGDSDSRVPGAHDDGPQGTEWVHYIPIEDYQDLLTHFPQSYFTPKRAELAEDMRTRIFPDQGHGEAYDDGVTAAYIYRYIYNYWNQALYTQIPAGYRYNWASCWSGCNNNAWAGLYGWWDKNMAKGNLIATTSTGETCPTYRDTFARQDVVDPAQMSLFSMCGTYCGSGTGWTYWRDAYKGYQFAWNRGYGYSVSWQWCNSAGCSVNLANILVDCIGNNYRPAHVGANSHFYIGTGLSQWDTNTDWTWVYGYPGWSQSHVDDVWIWWHDVNTATRVYVY